jgi:DeoR/GlpR family transcriptional regulator of sugar metabolism
VRRTYGGATAHLVRSLEVGFNARILQRSAEKRLIGRRAAELVGAARVLFVGTGTTTEQFSGFLPPRPDLTVVTPSLAIASLLGTRGIQTIILGGFVRQNELDCVGPLAVEAARRYNCELAIMGAAGVSARRGITELDDREAEIMRLAFDQAERVMVIADGSKFGAVAVASVAPIGRVATIVTDPSASIDELHAIRSAGVEVVVVSPRSSGPDPKEPVR